MISKEGRIIVLRGMGLRYFGWISRGCRCFGWSVLSFCVLLFGCWLAENAPDLFHFAGLTGNCRFYSYCFLEGF